MDRRVRKSKKYIDEAFYKLLENKELDKISITMITNEADIVRKTFYSHYIDKDDYLDNLIERHFDKLQEICDENRGNSLFDQSMKWLIFFEENALFFNQLLNSDSTFIFRKHIIEFIGKQIRDKYTQVNLDTSFDFAVLFVSNGLFGTVENSIKNKLPVESTAKEIASLIDALFFPK